MRSSTAFSILLWASLPACFSISNPHGGHDHADRPTDIAGKVFGTGTVTFSDHDVVIDADPSIVHVKAEGPMWSAGNALGTEAIPKRAFRLVIRTKEGRPEVVDFVAKDLHWTDHDAGRLGHATLFGFPAVTVDQSAGAIDSITFAGEHGSCYYALTVATRDLGEDGFVSFTKTVVAAIRGSSGPIPGGPACQ